MVIQKSDWLSYLRSSTYWRRFLVSPMFQRKILETLLDNSTFKKTEEVKFLELFLVTWLFVLIVFKTSTLACEENSLFRRTSVVFANRRDSRSMGEKVELSDSFSRCERVKGRI